MKRVLFCAGILALAASCAEDQFESVQVPQNQLKGISFGAELAQVPATRGDLAYNEDTKAYDFFWYAEKDRINIWSTNTTATGSNVATNGTSWNKDNKAQYKATQSAARGVFTGVDDNNILDFQYGPDDIDMTNPDDVEAKKSQFFAVYPIMSTVEEITGGKFRIGTLPALNAQDQTAKNGSDVTSKLMMYSLTEAVAENSYDAVGEKIDLKFVRPFTAMVFKTEGVDAYKEYFGKLKSIELEMKGFDKNADGDTDDEGDIKPSIIDYGQSGVSYLVDTENPEKSKLVQDDGSDISDWTTDVTGAASTITLKINGTTGLDWTDADAAYMAMNNVDRDAYVKAGAKESVGITYDFEYIQLPNYKPIATAANWPSVKGNNNFVGAPVLKIADYPYLVTKDRGTNERVLIVNSGKFNDIFLEGSNNGQIEWNEGSNPAVTAFNTIIVNEGVELSKAELALLKKFTALKSIKLAENTEIPAGTFTQTTLKDIDFPKVTVIAKGAFDSGVALENVKLPAYGFEDEVIAKEVLKATSLKTLDMSGVSAMNVGFPSTGFTLTNYTQLREVTVQDGVKLGANSFNGCAELATVNGKVEIGGAAVFKGCEDLVTINVVNADMKASAFENCTALKNILLDGAQVAPTAVETKAFAGCTALEKMNLRNVTGDLGQQAFKDCTALYGEVVDGTKNVLYVGGEHIGEGAFDGCTSLQHIEFLQATTFGKDILANTSATLIQVQFDEVFDVNYTDYAATTFGLNTTSVTLFINPSQPVSNYDDSHLFLQGVDDGIEFKAVQFK